MADEGGRETIDGEVLGCGSLGEGGFGANEQGLSFADVELQKVPSHPAADVLEAGEMDIVCNEVLGFTPTLWEFSLSVGAQMSRVMPKVFSTCQRIFGAIRRNQKKI